MKLEDLEAKLGIDPNMGEEEKLALVKEIQDNIPALRAEQRVLEAKTQANLVVEAIKKIKEGLEARFDELNGIVDVKVRDITSGKDGINGKNGKDGANGKDGVDGVSVTGPKGDNGADGEDGVGVQDAHIDFDGSLIIILTDGKEINVGEVVPMDVAEKIKIIGNGGGTSQSVLDSIESLQTQINTLIPSQTGNSGKYLTTNGTSTSWATVSSGSGTVTSVATSGTVNGITLTGGPITTTGTVTLGGTLDLSSPPAIGSTAASTGAFTTLSASSTVSGTGFITYLASPPAIGGTAAAAGTFTTLIGGNDVANYGQLTGGATTKAVEFKSLGSDTNVAYAIRPKGTGAIDLAAGSSGVNISNGGTVTALTRTAQGSGYTTLPSVAISAPTTAGGVQATANAIITILSYTISAGGSGYTVGDTVTLTGGTFTQAWSGTVATVSAGAITSITTVATGSYTVFPTGLASLTGGTGTGATLSTFSGGITSVITITNAGSGYVEQPTVTFSGGGGSGAAAYATVGSVPKITSIGGDLSFYTPGGEGFRVSDNGASTVNYISARGDTSTGNTPALLAAGASGVLNFRLSTKSSGSLIFATNSNAQTQLSVTHTASAVNYVQVTGAATNNPPEISSQGSDASISINYNAKNAGNHVFRQAGGVNFRVSYSVTTAVNNLAVTGSLAGSSPSLFSQGTDADIDLTLTPKGAGNVRFGTYTAGVLTPTGYITIKDSGGTTRRLLVG
jgi:hypothetical protein